MPFNSKCLLLFLSFSSFSAKAQVSDYKIYQDSVFNLCRLFDDSTSLTASIHQLETLDTGAITHNHHLYYRDLGFLNYKFYGISNDSQYLNKAILLYQTGLKYDTKNTLLLGDLIVFEFQNKHYKECLNYYEQLKAITKPSKDLKSLYKTAKTKQ